MLTDIVVVLEQQTRRTDDPGICRDYFKATVYTIWVHGPLGKGIIIAITVTSVNPEPYGVHGLLRVSVSRCTKVHLFRHVPTTITTTTWTLRV